MRALFVLALVVAVVGTGDGLAGVAVNGTVNTGGNNTVNADFSASRGERSQTLQEMLDELDQAQNELFEAYLNLIEAQYPGIRENLKNIYLVFYNVVNGTLNPGGNNTLNVNLRGPGGIRAVNGTVSTGGNNTVNVGFSASGEVRPYKVNTTEINIMDPLLAVVKAIEDRDQVNTFNISVFLDSICNGTNNTLLQAEKRSVRLNPFLRSKARVNGGSSLPWIFDADVDGDGAYVTGDVENNNFTIFYQNETAVLRNNCRFIRENREFIEALYNALYDELVDEFFKLPGFNVLPIFFKFVRNGTRAGVRAIGTAASSVGASLAKLTG